MRLTLILAMLIIVALLIVILVQGNVIALQQTLIREMSTNPYCMGLK